MAAALKLPNMLKNAAIYVDISYVKSFWTSGLTQCTTLSVGDVIRRLGPPDNSQCRTLDDTDKYIIRLRCDKG